jgi:hypothetical protein
MYTFDADCITSYELGSEEAGKLAVKSEHIFNSSTDYILSQMAKALLKCEL